MRSVDSLRHEAARCTRCDLYRDATQTVFGEGPVHARVVLLSPIARDPNLRPEHRLGRRRPEQDHQLGTIRTAPDRVATEGDVMRRMLDDPQGLIPIAS
jgi:hypothetical protein